MTKYGVWEEIYTIGCPKLVGQADSSTPPPGNFNCESTYLGPKPTEQERHGTLRMTSEERE